MQALYHQQYSLIVSLFCPYSVLYCAALDIQNGGPLLLEALAA